MRGIWLISNVVLPTYAAPTSCNVNTERVSGCKGTYLFSNKMNNYCFSAIYI